MSVRKDTYQEVHCVICCQFVKKKQNNCKQEKPREVQGNPSNMLLSADPNQTYRVRIRTRVSDFCQSKTQWSEWSHVVSKFGMLIIKHLPQWITGSPNTLS